MSSYLRNLQRKALRKHANYEPAPRPFIMLNNGGYKELHPTRGWKVISGARLVAQRIMAHILGA